MESLNHLLDDYSNLDLSEFSKPDTKPELFFVRYEYSPSSITLAKQGLNVISITGSLQYMLDFKNYQGNIDLESHTLFIYLNSQFHEADYNMDQTKEYIVIDKKFMFEPGICFNTLPSGGRGNQIVVNLSYIQHIVSDEVLKYFMSRDFYRLGYTLLKERILKLLVVHVLENY